MRETTRRGLDARFEALVGAHQHRVYACALALTGRWADAEEAAQETFLRAYRALSGFEEQRLGALQERAWLHRICVNVCRNRHRAAAARPVPVALDGGGEPADRSAGPEASALESDRRRRLVAALGTLPVAQREAVVLRHVHGYSSAQAAQILGIPEGTLKSNLFRGLAGLRRRLTAEEVAI